MHALIATCHSQLLVSLSHFTTPRMLAAATAQPAFQQTQLLCLKTEQAALVLHVALHDQHSHVGVRCDSSSKKLTHSALSVTQHQAQTSNISLYQAAIKPAHAVTHVCCATAADSSMPRLTCVIIV